MNDGLRWIEQAAREAGRTVDAVVANPVVRTVAGVVRLGSVLNAVERVDVDQVQAEVDRFRREHPDEGPAALAGRIIAEKAAYAGGIGLAGSVVPGFLAGLLAIDLAANLLLQAQMVYQIAAVYGLDLRNPDRKGEVVLIFALAFGGNQALRLGLAPLVRLPLVGSLVEAGTSATTLYALGQAACRFYEAKLAATTDPTAA
ncbi:EcsC family protein [Gloeobacter kilaueensis]|uniref:EcsC protein family protein n=1 Tax=Gloeobacter kilaueensis (strain ATCC BAA-2537 / CCAP 1431/1 / ULC 316 / JS1) TaxID=1183438 RepID=U5QGE3_GLOK1|nr:EcsC family protein [Gloeobacter kilaueensis]AGY58037.1 hypothetical protein GKIL_1791 [Gloeobacter kilaueensis JS1]